MEARDRKGASIIAEIAAELHVIVARRQRLEGNEPDERF
jgi:hypothetical protein